MTIDALKLVFSGGLGPFYYDESIQESNDEQAQELYDGLLQVLSGEQLLAQGYELLPQALDGGLVLSLSDGLVQALDGGPVQVLDGGPVQVFGGGPVQVFGGGPVQVFGGVQRQAFSGVQRQALGGVQR